MSVEPNAAEDNPFKLLDEVARTYQSVKASGLLVKQITELMEKRPFTEEETSDKLAQNSAKAENLNARINKMKVQYMDLLSKLLQLVNSDEECPEYLNFDSVHQDTELQVAKLERLNEEAKQLDQRNNMEMALQQLNTKLDALSSAKETYLQKIHETEKSIQQKEKIMKQQLVDIERMNYDNNKRQRETERLEKFLTELNAL